MLASSHHTTALALLNQTSNSSPCFPSLVNAPPRCQNYPTCLNNVPPTCRQHLRQNFSKDEVPVSQF